MDKLYNIYMDNLQKNMLIPSFTVKSIYTILYLKLGKSLSIPKAKQGFWEMVYVDEGTAEITCNQKSHTIKQGQAFFLTPNADHSFFSGSETTTAVISFECSSRATKNLRDRIFNFNEKEKSLLSEILAESGKTYTENPDGRLNKMTKLEDAPFGSEQIIKNDLENLLVHLIRGIPLTHSPNKKNAPHLKTEDLAEKIIEILKSKIYSTMSLDELSGSLYFSKTYLKSVFHKHTGTSIIQFYIDLKIEEAKKLIAKNKYSFTEIADRLCINSVHYFSRLFKQRTGMSPSKYALSLRADSIIK